ncbi:MAG: PIN domain-containing protein [Chitinophagaceae bacterium]|nr:PIN domain-containing protein [Chitinophagaceae bacterium]
MAFKIMLDANIILDLTLKREDYKTAKEVISLAINGTVNAFITPSILHICGYWLTKAYGHPKAKEILLSLLADIRCVDIPHEMTIASLHSSIKDIEDALQYYTALHHKMDYFISHDRRIYKEAAPVLPAYSPEEFLNIIAR